MNDGNYKKIGNYIRVDTTTSDDKNYLNQQHKQLNPTTFRGKEKNNAWCQQVYKSQKICAQIAKSANY